uniref:Translation initiation factor eIF2B subunit gamma n=1 Tax=Ascaris lumbricoides TaxID=6252 RepID=A0A0M3ING9_ASCLU
MKRWILDVVKEQRTLSSIKADLIPYLLEKQYSSLDAEMIPHLKVDRLTELANQFSFGTPLIASTPQLRCFAYIVTPENGSIIAHVNNIGAYFEVNKAGPEIVVRNEVSEFSFSFGTPLIAPTPQLRCFAYIITPENGSIIAHVNNIGAYFELNKAILRFLTVKFCESFPPGQKVDHNGAATLGESYVSKTVRFVDGRIGDGATVSRTDKPIIKRSVVGAGCEIALRAKITNSLIMDRCIIGAGAQITNTIVCSDAEIEEGAEVMSSIVTNRQKIPANANVQNELVVAENEMDIEE